MDFFEIPLSEIMLATNDFNEECHIGSGAYGDVYRAELDVLDVQSLLSMEVKCKEKLPKIRKRVAIKRIASRQDEQGLQGFLAEIEMLISCKHPNLIALVGFSRETDVLVLVYEYASKGSLCDFLKSGKTAFNLSWAERLQICLDIAYGISYLHFDTEEKPWILHRDIKSDNILLDENLNAKLCDFGLAKLHRKIEFSTVRTMNIAGTGPYIDPEYFATGKYKRESDIYSFGVVLFEVLSGRVAYDSIFLDENDIGLAPIARRRFIEGTLKELIDPKMMEEYNDYKYSLYIGPNEDSFDKFSKIAYQCLAETQAKRPTMKVVIEELQDALILQGDNTVLSRFLLPDIMLATNNFSKSYRNGSDTNGTVYKAELNQFGNNTVAIKRITASRKHGFFEELEMRAYKHPNIVPLIGFCDDVDEMMLVYEHSSGKSLDDYFQSVDSMDSFTWTHRLHMCLEIARGLHHLHTKMVDQSLITIDIRSANILIDKNGKTKIAYFVVSNPHPKSQDIKKKVYEDPEYETSWKLERKSDIYSFGVVLLEIFCGRVAYDQIYIEENDGGLAHIARNDQTIERIMDPRLKEETDNEDMSTSNRGPNQDSLNVFLKVAYGCLGKAAKRPTMDMVIKELERALNLQEPKQASGIISSAP